MNEGVKKKWIMVTEIAHKRVLLFVATFFFIQGFVSGGAFIYLIFVL